MGLLIEGKQVRREEGWREKIEFGPGARCRLVDQSEGGLTTRRADQRNPARCPACVEGGMAWDCGVGMMA